MSKTQKKSSSNPTSSSAFPPVKGASHTPALPADAQRPYTAAELKDKGETRPQTTWKLPPPSRRIGASASASPTKPSRSHDIRREKSMPERVRTQMTRPQTTAGGGSPEALSKYQSADSGRRPPFAVPAGRKLEDAPIIKVEAETVRKTLKDPTVSRPSTTAALAKEVGSSNGDGDDTDDAERGDDEGSEKIHDIAQWQAYAQKRWPWKAAYANQRRAERLHMGKSSGYGRMEGKASEASSSVSGFWKKSGSHFISQIGLTAWAVTSADLVQQKQKQLYRQSLARNHATGEWKRDGKMAAHARRRGNATQELKWLLEYLNHIPKTPYHQVMAHIHISKYWARQNVHHEALASALIARDILHSLDPQMKAEDSEFNENTHGLQDARKYLKGNDEPQGSEGESQQVATSEGKPEATVTEGRPESDAHDETPPAPETDMSATHHRRSHHRIRQDEAQRAHSRDWILQAEAAVDALVAALVKQRVEDVKVTLDKVDEVQAHVQELQTLSPTLSPKSNRGSSSRPQSKQAPQKDDPALRVSVNARPISRGTFGIRSSKGDVVEVL